MTTSKPPRSATTFFFDLRCPFCFVQRERIEALGLLDGIVYQSVRHDRPLPVPAREPTADERAFLERELEMMRARAPDEPLAPLAIWPSTAPAARLVAAVSRLAPDAVGEVVRALYRSIWREGRDPSSPILLGEIARRALPRGSSPNDLDDATCARWTVEWERDSDEKRTPALRSAHGAMLVGMAEPRRLETFLRSGRVASDNDGAC